MSNRIILTHNITMYVTALPLRHFGLQRGGVSRAPSKWDPMESDLVVYKGQAASPGSFWFLAAKNSAKYIEVRWEFRNCKVRYQFV